MTDKHDMISRKAAIDLRQHIANMIGALPNSSIDAALREYANTLRALPSVGVTVKPLEWEDSLKGRWIGTPDSRLGNLAFWVFL